MGKVLATLSTRSGGIRQARCDCHCGQKKFGALGRQMENGMGNGNYRKKFDQRWAWQSSFGFIPETKALGLWISEGFWL